MIGILTGSGTYALPGFEGAGPEEVATPLGPEIVSTGSLAGTEVLHIARHRAGHELLSSQVTHQANVWALREHGVRGVLAVTVCGALDPVLELGTLVVFDDLHFLVNRLPDGSIRTLHTEPGAAGRGRWIVDGPFAEPLRDALLAGAREAGHAVRDGGCYGHVDGPRFNTRAEIGALRQAGVTVSRRPRGPRRSCAATPGCPTRWSATRPTTPTAWPSPRPSRTSCG